MIKDSLNKTWFRNEPLKWALSFTLFYTAFTMMSKNVLILSDSWHFYISILIFYWQCLLLLRLLWNFMGLLWSLIGGDAKIIKSPSFLWVHPSIVVLPTLTLQKNWFVLNRSRYLMDASIISSLKTGRKIRLKKNLNDTQTALSDYCLDVLIVTKYRENNFLLAFFLP